MTFQMAFVSQNPLTYLVIPNTWTQIPEPEPEPEPGQLLIPIKLVFCLIFDKKLRNFVTFYLTLTEKIRVGPSQRTRTQQTVSGSRLVDPVDDEDVEEIVHELILQLWQCDLKKMEEY
jgi:hypothetical protein